MVGKAVARGAPKAHEDPPPVTVTAQVAVLLPSCVVTVMVALPAATPVTKPVALTVATEVLLEVQVTVLLVAFAGATVAVNWALPAGAIEAVVGLTVTPVTGTIVEPTVITNVFVLIHPLAFV